MYLGDQKITDLRDKPASLTGNGMYCGPTAIDFSMLPTRNLVPLSEAKSLKEWRERDLADYYREIRRRDLK